MYFQSVTDSLSLSVQNVFNKYITISAFVEFFLEKLYHIICHYCYYYYYIIIIKYYCQRAKQAKTLVLRGGRIEPCTRYREKTSRIQRNVTIAERNHIESGASVTIR